MPLKPGKTKPTLAERKKELADKENSQRGKRIDKKRQRKTSRNGGALKRNKKIELSGDERFYIQKLIQDVPLSARTLAEKRLLEKVK